MQDESVNEYGYQCPSFFCIPAPISAPRFIGPNATLTNDRHPPSGGKWKPVIVEDGVVIGANATIVAGVRLNTGCVIAAGAVVTTDIPASQVWGGVPAKLLMTRDEYNSRRDLD